MGAVLGAFICLIFAFLDKILSDVDVLSLYIVAIGVFLTVRMDWNCGFKLRWLPA